MRKRTRVLAYAYLLLSTLSVLLPLWFVLRGPESIFSTIETIGAILIPLIPVAIWVGVLRRSRLAYGAAVLLLAAGCAVASLGVIYGYRDPSSFNGFDYQEGSQALVCIAAFILFGMITSLDWLGLTTGPWCARTHGPVLVLLAVLSLWVLLTDRRTFLTPRKPKLVPEPQGEQ